MRRARLAFLTLLALLPRVGSAVPIETRAYVATSDFTTGGLSAATLATHAVASDVASVYADATLRWWGGKLYVVNRFGQDNIQVIDPALGYATVKQFSVGSGANPQDIAVVSPTKAYVSCLGLDHLLIVDPSAGAVTGSIPLARFADSDGLPEAARMARFGDRLFVALQRLVNFAPAETSLVAVIDTDADTVLDVDPGRPGVQAIPLHGRNPVTSFDYDPFGARLLIGCAGAYGVLDGGIEAIPMASGDVIVPGQPLYASAGFVVTEQELGGDIGAFAFLLPGHSYAIVSDASYNSSVVTWSTLTGHRTGTVYSAGGFYLSDLRVSLARDELWFCDTKPTAPGLRVFRCSTDSPLAGPLATGLPPQQLTFDRDDVDLTPAFSVDVPAPRRAAGGALALAAPWPNPARDAMVLALSAPAGAAVAIDVLDLAGRRVRALAVVGTGGEAPVRWDLRDDAGNRVTPGVYLVRARAGGLSTTRQIVAVR